MMAPSTKKALVEKKSIVPGAINFQYEKQPAAQRKILEKSQEKKPSTGIRIFFLMPERPTFFPACPFSRCTHTHTALKRSRAYSPMNNKRELLYKIVFKPTLKFNYIIVVVVLAINHEAKRWCFWLPLIFLDIIYRVLLTRVCWKDNFIV